MTIYVLDLCSLCTIIFGMFVITAKNPIISVLFLIAVFMNVAVYLVLHGVAYLGLAYIIVYIGAIAILFLFVIIMLNINVHLTPDNFFLSEKNRRAINSTTRINYLNYKSGDFAQIYPLASVLSLLFMWQIYSIFSAGKSASWSIISSYTHWVLSTPRGASLDWFSVNLFSTNPLYLSVPIDSKDSAILNITEYMSYTGSQVISDSLFNTFSQIENIGTSIYGYNVAWLIITSIILLVGIIGPILLCIDFKLKSAFVFTHSPLFKIKHFCSMKKKSS